MAETARQVPSSLDFFLASPPPAPLTSSTKNAVPNARVVTRMSKLLEAVVEYPRALGSAAGPPVERKDSNSRKHGPVCCRKLFGRSAITRTSRPSTVAAYRRRLHFCSAFQHQRAKIGAVGLGELGRPFPLVIEGRGAPAQRQLLVLDQVDSGPPL